MLKSNSERHTVGTNRASDVILTSTRTKYYTMAHSHRAQLEHEQEEEEEMVKMEKWGGRDNYNGL